MRGSKKEVIEQLEAHCKGKWPREFAKKLKRGFHRNDRLDSAEELYNKAEFFDFEDCYCSVYAFKEWHDEAVIRKHSAIIDCLVFDLDHADPMIAFKEAKKLIKWLMDRNITPRVYFSGAKGFHVYIDFKPIELKNPAEAIKRAGVYIKERLKLRTVDTAIWELNRVIRLPFTVNTKTGYKCTPLKADKILNLDFNSVLHFCKLSYSPIEVHESRTFPKFLRYEDFRVTTNKALSLILKPRRAVKGKDSGWRSKRIQEYVEALRKYGRLTADPVIAKRHEDEHKARLHLNFLMIEAGYSDEEIKEVFKLCEDYRPEIVEYQVRYNRNWLKRRVEA